MILLNKKFFFASLVLIILENAFVIFDDEKSFQRFFSFLLSLALVNVLFWMKDKPIFLTFQFFTFTLIYLLYMPLNIIVSSPHETPVPIVVCFIIIFLTRLNIAKAHWKYSIIFIFLFFIGFYFENRTLIASIVLFFLVKLFEIIFARNYLSKSYFYSIIFPFSLIAAVIILGNQIQNPTILGFRDYFWASAIFGNDTINRIYTLPIDPFKIVYLNHLVENNVHNNFVGLFSRLNIIVAISSWFLFYHIIKLAYSQYLNDWKVQLSLFVLICQSLFTGRSLFSLDDFTIIFWFGIFSIISSNNAYKKIEYLS
tara:strand:- start:4644 stop:5579 length:936 start_codon:yes stop_codon:yes gene_type:complete